MNSRIQVAFAVALATIVLIAIGAPITWWWWSRVHAPAAARTELPVLDNEQLRMLPAYKRECRKQADCEPPLACVHAPRQKGWRCLASECDADHQCEPGFMCAPYKVSDALAIRLCIIQGTQNEGERCERFPLDQNHGCRPGLICNAWYCGRPCEPERASACLDGFACHDWDGEPTCLPSCLRSGCPPEKQCIRLEGEFSVCATVLGQDCDKQPCPKGEKCQRELGYRWWPQVVKMWCALPCAEEKDEPCTTGSTCFNGSCAKLCDEQAPGTCAPGDKCTTISGPNGRHTICLISE